ncbi:MAG: mannose-6-phosphate isomerase-like protein (cupin superfamily) [Planctomycetota bacterium]
MPNNLGMTEQSPAYELDGRELIAEAPGLRVQVLTLGHEQCVPWHHHTQISDSFFCLEGHVVLDTRQPSSVLHLRAGQRATVPPMQPRRVTAA